MGRNGEGGKREDHQHGKGKTIALIIPLSTQRGFMQQIKSQLRVYEVLVNSGEIEHFYIASDSILSAMTAARNFGFIPISAVVMPDSKS